MRRWFVVGTLVPVSCPSPAHGCVYRIIYMTGNRSSGRFVSFVDEGRRSAMAYTTLIAAPDLAAHLSDPNWAVIDARFTLNDPDRGEGDYVQAHIPGAVYAHLNRDMAGPVIPGQTGRHPLPAIEDFAHTAGRWG